MESLEKKHALVMFARRFNAINSSGQEMHGQLLFAGRKTNSGK